MKKDKIRLYVMAAGLFTMLLGAALFAYMAYSKNEVNTSNIVYLMFPLLIMLIMIPFVLRRFKDVKRGMPMEDERSKKVINRAAAMAYYISIYWILIVGWFEKPITEILKIEMLTTSQTTGICIMGMAIIFFISWFYYDKKGKLV